MPEYTPNPMLDAGITLARKLEESDRVYEADLVRRLVEAAATNAAHDAIVRADQAEKDAQMVGGNLGRAWVTSQTLVEIAAEIRRAVVLTPTTKETEQ